MQSQNQPKYNSLNAKEIDIIENKGTEAPFTGKYYMHNDQGQYLCKKCNAPLYNSNDKFDSHCGWPSFDDEISGAITKIQDADGRRTEILCSNCGAHLGHIFEGEGYTQKNIRHCVNSISLNFVPTDIVSNEVLDTAIYAGGCFWGMEYYFQKLKGVEKTEVGYIGGHIDYPSYQDVCTKESGHYEALRVTYNSKIISFEEISKLYFEIHDPTQANGQGPDIGSQYRSAVFCQNIKQEEVIKKLINILSSKGLKVVTEIKGKNTFWIAEDYHQQYYEKKGGSPYCHFRVKRF